MNQILQSVTDALIVIVIDTEHALLLAAHQDARHIRKACDKLPHTLCRCITADTTGCHDHRIHTLFPCIGKQCIILIFIDQISCRHLPVNIFARQKNNIYPQPFCLTDDSPAYINRKHICNSAYHNPNNRTSFHRPSPFRLIIPKTFLNLLPAAFQLHARFLRLLH